LRTFGTTTAELLELADWLREHEVAVVAMESTGIFWRPVWNILEGYEFDLVLANARQIKNLPGRKTDQRDAEWLAQLLRCGLVQRSFVPAVEQRDLRDLTRRRRTLLQDMSSEKNRVHKTLQDANVKLTSVVTDIFGVSGRALIDALDSGADFTAESVLAVVKGSLRKKVPALIAALDGRIRPHHLKMIGFAFEHIDFLQQQVKAIEDEIEANIAPLHKARELICTIPGLEKAAATEILAEIGGDMSVFHSDAHLASWAGVSPGNFESAGKSKGGRTAKGNRYLKAVLVQAGWSAARTKDTRLSGRYRRLARRLGRDGKKKAIVATAHSILRITYFILSTGRPYLEFGPEYGAASAEARTRRLVAQLERLGYMVTKAA
jgi:transposase